MAQTAAAAETADQVGARALYLPQRLERLPFTSYQRTIFLIIGTAWLFDSVDLAMITFVLAPISTEFGLSGGQSGLLASASFAGMLIGASVAGMLADRIGRKAVFQWSMVVWGTASILAGLSWDLTSLLVFRFVLGLGMGAEFPIAQSLVSEFIPAKQRGRYIAYLEGFWPLGFIAAGVLAYVLVPLAGWRAVFVAEGLPAIYVLVIRRMVPESPRWFESRGRIEEAEHTMQAIERQVERVSGQVLPPPLAGTFVEAAATRGRLPLAELFSRQYAGRTLMSWVMWFGILLGYYGITTWMGKLLVDRGLTVVRSIEFVILMTLWGVPGFFSAAYAVEKVGRRPAVIGYVLLSAIAAFFYGRAGSQTEVIIVGAVMQFFFFGMWSVLYAYTPELFPTRARATGCGTASAAGRLGALIGPAVVPFILVSYGTEAVFTLGAVAFVVAAVAVLLFGPETKNKMLEEISA